MNRYEMACVLSDKEKEIEQLKNKYEKSGQKCGNGHVNNLPIKLWDCPVCTEKLRNEIKNMKATIGWLKFLINEYGSHKADCKIYHGADCNCGYERQDIKV